MAPERGNDVDGDRGNLEIRLASGRTCTLGELCQEGPMALVFLRHLGCIFCRENVCRLAREAPHDRIFLVAMAEPDQAREFLRRYPTPHQMICDPERRLFEAFGLERGSIGQLFGPKVWIRGAKAMASGHRQGRVQGDPYQLPGSFILDRETKVVWSHLAKHAADTAEPATLAALLRTLS